MKRILKLWLITITMASIIAIPVYAGKPEHQITGGGRLTSDMFHSLGESCQISISAREVSGSWSGHGVLTDRDSGERVVFTVDTGVFLSGTSSSSVILEGPCKFYQGHELVSVGTASLYYEIFADHAHLIVNFIDGGSPVASWGTWIGLSAGNINLR